MTVPSRSLYKIRVRFYISVSLLEKSGCQTSGTLIVTPVRCMVGWYGTSYWLQSGPLFERACRLKLCLSWRISFVQAVWGAAGGVWRPAMGGLCSRRRPTAAATGEGPPAAPPLDPAASRARLRECRRGLEAVELYRVHEYAWPQAPSLAGAESPPSWYLEELSPDDRDAELSRDEEVARECDIEYEEFLDGLRAFDLLHEDCCSCPWCQTP